MEMSAVVIWKGCEDDAKALLQAITPDDGSAFTAEIHKVDEIASLRVLVDAKSLRSMRATVDDILACLSAAESALDAASVQHLE